MSDYPRYSLDTIGQFFSDNATELSVEIAYNKVGFFRRAVDIRRNGVANMPFDLTKGETEIANDQTINKTDVPNAIDVFKWIPAWTTDLDMYGAAYGIYLDDKEFGIPGGAWVRIHPSRVTPIYGNRGTITHWQISSFEIQKQVPFERLLAIWQPNQTSDRGHGKPIALAALTSAGVLNYSGTFQSSFFEQGALTPSIIGVDGFDKKSPTIKNQVRDLFRKLFGGIDKAHQVQVVDGKTTVVTLQQNLKDMALTELSREQKETISATFGVPLSLIMSNASNYATATQDDFNFYDKAVNPFLLEVLGEQLNLKLFIPMGYSLDYQASRLDAYQAIELQKSSTLNGMLDREVISIAEYRESMQLPPIGESEEELIDDTKLPEVFGYHIDAGIVTRNEVRERLGYPPEADTGQKELSNLQAKLVVMKDAVDTGIPPEEAAKLVGVPASFSQPKDDDLNKELKRWEKKAVKRYLEGNETKALEFASLIIPETLSDKIKSTLATVHTVDSVKTVFRDARNHA